MPPTLSISLITHNEAANLPRTLASLRLISGVEIEIIVVDSGSTDATLQIARSFGALVFEEPWKGFAAQKNSALSHATGDWVLSLDADEELSPGLTREIQSLLATNPPLAAYRVPRLNHFLGRPMRHGGYWPDPKLRLFRRSAARFKERPVHETLHSDGPVGQLSGHLIHHCYPTMDEYLEHMNRYSSAGAEMLVASGRAGNSWPWLIWNGFLNPAATFVYNYFVRLGFLDGREGLLQHANHSAYIHWKYAKAWQTARDKRSPRP